MLVTKTSAEFRIQLFANLVLVGFCLSGVITNVDVMHYLVCGKICPLFLPS